MEMNKKRIKLLKEHKQDLLEQRLNNLERLEILRGGMKQLSEGDHIDDITDWLGYTLYDNKDTLRDEIVDEGNELQYEIKRLQRDYKSTCEQLKNEERKPNEKGGEKQENENLRTGKRYKVALFNG